MTDKKPNSLMRSFTKSWPVIISLALNLFLIGIVAAPLFGPPPFGPFAPPLPPHESSLPPEFVIDRIADKLPLQDAEAVHKIMADKKDQLIVGHQEMQKAVDRMISILDEDKPDPKVLQDALDKMEATTDNIHELMGHVAQRIAADISAESRHKMVSMFRKMHEPKWPRDRSSPFDYRTGSGPWDNMMPPPPPGMPPDKRPASSAK